MRIVRVIWNDAQDHAQKWVDQADAEAFGEIDCEVTSIGFLISQTAKYVTLAGDFDSNDNDFGRVTKIPVGMIKDIRDLG